LIHNFNILKDFYRTMNIGLLCHFVKQQIGKTLAFMTVCQYIFQLDLKLNTKD